ncbi:MAG: hypothetical protein ABFD76_16600 [Smithella sp.]
MNKIDKVLILDALKEHYRFDRDRAFAEFLGIQPTVLSNWYSRKTLDWDVIFTKCVDIDFDKLIKEGLTDKTQKTIKNKTTNENIAYDKSVLEMIRDIAIENGMLKKEIENLKIEKEHVRKCGPYRDLAAEP